MMLRLPFGVLVASACLLGPMVQHRSLALDYGAKERFLAEAPEGWKTFRESARHVKASVLDKRVWAGAWEDREEERQRFTFKFSGDNGLSECRPVRGLREKICLQCINSRYGFELKKGSEERPWTVSYLAQTPDERALVNEWLEWDAGPLAEYPLWVEFIALPELVEHPNFKVHDVRFEKGEDGTDCVVKFTFFPSEGIKPYLRGGTMVLDPDHLWVVRRYNCHWQDERGKGTGEAEWEYLTGDGREHPIPVRRIRRSKGDVSKIEFEWTHRYDEYEYRKFPEEEFTLSACGLPEIGQGPANGYRALVQTLGFGLLFLVLGVAVVHRRLARWFVRLRQ